MNYDLPPSPHNQKIAYLRPFKQPAQPPMEQLLSFDRHLFRVINDSWSNSFFNWLMPWMRNAYLWYPLYLFLILLVAINYKKQAWIWILLGAATVFLADLVSSSIIKTTVWRLRPCNDPGLASWIHVLVGYRPQSSSFTSSHATNHFALATYIYITLKPLLGKWGYLFFGWAALIAFAQVYVGVHYPFDVLAGALIGMMIGYLFSRIFLRMYNLVPSI